MEAQVVGDGLAGVVAVEAVELFEVGVGDFPHVFGNLDFGDDMAGFVLHGGQLVHAAEDRLAPCGNQPLAHAEQIDAGPLPQQVLDEVLVQGVGHGDFALGPPGLVQHFPGFPG